MSSHPYSIRSSLAAPGAFSVCIMIGAVSRLVGWAGLAIRSACSIDGSVATQLGRLSEFTSQSTVYANCGLLGEGCHGVVFEVVMLTDPTADDTMCSHPSSTGDDRLALKCIYDDGDNRYRGLKSQVDVLRHLELFPWILRPVDYFWYSSDVECVVMHNGGPSLLDDPNTNLTVFQRITVALKMIDIIEQLHGAGWVHRDIHLGNWLMRDLNPETLKLIDFDMAAQTRDKDQRSEDYRDLTETIVYLLDAAPDRNPRSGILAERVASMTASAPSFIRPLLWEYVTGGGEPQQQPPYIQYI